MRTAPAVSVLCSGAGAWRGLRALTPGLATAAVVAWAVGHAQQPGLSAPWVAVPTALLVACWAWWQARPAPLRLSWDGQTWAADGAAGRLEVMIDIGPWLLLRLRINEPAPADLWIPVSAADTGPAMHALRAALYGRAPRLSASAPPAEQGGAAGAD